MASTNTSRPAPSPFSGLRLAAGLACLIVSLAATLVLAGKMLNVLEAPGCGEGSPCDEAAASLWGSVPVLGWPTAFVGLAYFAALTIAWLAAYAGSGVTAGLRNLVRVGAAASVVFLVAMIAGGYICLYCVAAHLGNFGFLFVTESAPRASAPARGALAWATAAFAVVTGIELGMSKAVEGRVRETFDQSRQEIVDAAKQPPRELAGEPFTGRYRQGPADAPIRLVIFSDYQCPDCRRIERQIREIMAERDDVSVSHKHHPFNADCNPYVSKSLHGNACWAARAAEAAGILGGNEAFWRAHEWLFDHQGRFTDAAFPGMAREWGFDPGELERVMTGNETLRRVRADVEEAETLGIYQTPMIFVNGQELKGWNVPGAVRMVVEDLAATNPPPGDARQDRPPTAFEKYLADWREQHTQQFLPDQYAWTKGPADAPAQILVWGDYQERNTADFDRLLREILAGRDDVRYTFRHYPVDQSCNPYSPKTLHPEACRMARAAEAAGRLGGNDAYWAMHEWLLDNQRVFSDAALDAFAVEIGLDPELLFAEMDSPAVSAEIAGDAQAAMKAGLGGVPLVFIDGKYVPRWRREGVVEAMIAEAARE